MTNQYRQYETAMKPFYLIWLAILFGSPKALGDSRKLFLSVGINNYENPYYRDLKFAAKDAEDISIALRDKFSGGLVLKDQGLSPTGVKRSDVLAELDRLVKENRDEQDIVLVYISAHGTIGLLPNGRIEKYLVTSDTNPRNLDQTAVSHTEIYKRFNALHSRKKVLIFDSCYSGTGKSRLSEKMIDQLARSKGDFFRDPVNDLSEGVVTLTASAFSEEADEVPELKNGRYTHYLIKGFDRDYNGDGAVSITEAHEFATQKVIEDTKGRQNPSARLEMVGEDPIIIRGSKSSGSPILFAYEEVMRKLSVEINGANLGSLNGKGGGGFIVAEGSQKLVLRDSKGQILVDRHVNFVSGMEYSLSNFIHYDPHSSLRLSTWLGEGIFGSKANDSLSSSIEGIQFEYQQKESIEGYGLQIRALIIPSYKDTFESKGKKIQQLAQGGRIGLLLGSFHRISKSNAPDWRLYRSHQLGLGWIYLQRKISDLSFKNRKQVFSSPGVLGSAEIGLESLSANIQVGLRAGLETYISKNQSKNATQILVTGELLVGYTW
ncbi:MAG: hypothetical protein EOP04_06210 [Proteobacteria bacterium]|nr:MAG: hypothetical protein EOP04_06210 [Pseudomonadota bacterium]